MWRGKPHVEVRSEAESRDTIRIRRFINSATTGILSRMNIQVPLPTPPVLAPALTRFDANGIATLTLNRPEARNPLSEALLAALSSELTAIAADSTIRAVIIAAEGSVFCAGHDLKEMSARRTDADYGRAYFADILSRCARMMQQIVTLPQPVIAAVEGVATAAGCQIVATCDLAVAGADARFCTPGVHIGLFCSTPMVALSRNVSHKHAMEMLLLGEMADAETAHRYGLVNHVAAAGGALAGARAMALIIAGKSPLTMKIGKQAFYRQSGMSLEDAYGYASSVMLENMLARDAEEGIGAFVEKREPVWEGR
jgi:enoyl-CoA hydratase/carnithine racemase